MGFLFFFPVWVNLSRDISFPQNPIIGTIRPIVGVSLI